MNKKEFIEKWKWQRRPGYGNILFDSSKELKKDLSTLLSNQNKSEANSIITEEEHRILNLLLMPKITEK